MSKFKFAVIGCPIKHTMSPFINKRLFELDNVDADYEVYEVEKIENDIEMLKKLNGFNITIPHKKDIIPYLDFIGEKARLCGSVNTVLIKDNKLYGTSTDGIGMRLSLESHGLSFKGKILLLGNGGAARAVAYEALDYADELIIAARNLDNAEKLKEELIKNHNNKNVNTCLLFNIPSDKYDLIINTTSVGMYPNPDFSPIDEDVIKNAKAVYDAVYNPHETLFIKKAKSLGVKAVHGMEMLVNQAAAAHSFWLGEDFKPYSDADIKKLTEDSVSEMNRHFKN